MCLCADTSVLWSVRVIPPPFPTPSVEEQTLQDKMQAEVHPDDFDVDTASTRLNEIYERMNEVGVCVGGGDVT
jgi:hypothetical protein